MKQVVTQAIVLNRIDYGETDRIVTLLTSSEGKKTVIAKGVRKPKSRMAGGIELFSVNNVVYIDGKSDMKTLISTRLITHFGDITKQLSRSLLGYDILKYTNLYTESVCEDEYFEVLQLALEALNNADIPESLVWLWFGVHLLHISGHAINVVTGADGSPMHPQDQFLFDYENMAFFPHANGEFSSRHIKLIRLSQTANPVKLLQIHDVNTIASELLNLITDCIKYGTH